MSANPDKDRLKIEADVVKSLTTRDLDYMDRQKPRVEVQAFFNLSSAGIRVAQAYLNHLKAQSYDAYLTHGFEGNKTSFLVVARSVPARVAEELRDLLTSKDSPDPDGKAQLVAFRSSVHDRLQP